MFDKLLKDFKNFGEAIYSVTEQKDVVCPDNSLDGNEIRGDQFYLADIKNTTVLGMVFSIEMNQRSMPREMEEKIYNEQIKAGSARLQ